MLVDEAAGVDANRNLLKYGLSLMGLGLGCTVCGGLVSGLVAVGVVVMDVADAAYVAYALSSVVVIGAVGVGALLGSVGTLFAVLGWFAGRRLVLLEQARDE